MMRKPIHLEMLTESTRRINKEESLTFQLQHVSCPLYLSKSVLSLYFKSSHQCKPSYCCRPELKLNVNPYPDVAFTVSLEVPSSNLVESGSKKEKWVSTFCSLDKAVELDYHWVEFDDVRYHVQVTMKNPHLVLLSVSLPTPPPEAIFLRGLPSGAIEAIKAAYGLVVQILDPPRDGFNLTLKLNLSKLSPDEEIRQSLLVKIASVREVVLGAPLRVVLKHLATRTVATAMDQLLALVHRPKESFFIIPEAERVTVVFPMRFSDSIDTVLATSFLQEFVEARRTAGLNNAPLCLWSPSPPLELKEAPSEALSANAGFVTFVIFPRHVEGKKLDRTVWNLSTFHAYVSYHVKCSEGFMHTRMRRRVESMIQTLDRAKPDLDKAKKSINNRSFKRLTLKELREGRSNSMH